MRRHLLTLAILLLLAGAAHAQWSTPIELYAGTGTGWSQAPNAFEENFDGDVNVFLGAGTRSLPFMTAMLKLELHRFRPGNANVDGGGIQAQLIGLGGKADLELKGSPVKPFIMLGGGLSFLRQGGWSSADPGFAVGGQTDLFFDYGAGVEAMLTERFGLWASGRVVHLMVSPVNSRVGSAIRFNSLTIGLKWMEEL